MFSDMSKVGDFIKSFGFFSPLSIVSSLLGVKTPFSKVASKFTGANIGSSAGSLFNKYTGAGLTGAEKEANAFTAQQTQAQMDFQKMMSDTAYQRQVSDMKAAGINPALAMGGSASGASSPPGASGSSVAPNSGDITGLAKMMMDLSLLKSQKRLLDEQARKTANEADKTAVDTKMVELTLEWYPKVQDVQIRRINGEVDNLFKDLDVKESLIAKQDAETALADTKKSVEELNREWIPRLNAAKEGLDLANTVQSYAEAAYKRYCLDFAKTHDGLIPGYNQILGIGAAISGTLEQIGLGSKNTDDIDWYEAAFPFLSMLTKRVKK